MRYFMIVVVSLITVLPITAQSDTQPEPISAANVHRLQSVAQVNFADYTATYGSGWLTIDNQNNRRFATLDADETVVIWDDSGAITATYQVRNASDLVMPVTDVDLNGEHIWSVHANGENYVLAHHHLSDNKTQMIPFPVVNARDMPIELWTDCALPLECRIHAEVLSDTGDYVATFIAQMNPLQVNSASIINIPYTPSQDPDAIVRIGRIQPPYTVTSSRDGIVKLWNIETGEIRYEVDNGTGEAAVFGAINHDATHLVWRDSRNESLYLLDFATGENQFIGGLDGKYAQWYFLSSDSSVVLAVNFGFEPIVVAWDIATGERTILGEYRPCSRPQPDMARLSADGTTLVIGCDTGLDIWRVVPENQ